MSFPPQFLGRKYKTHEKIWFKKKRERERERSGTKVDLIA